MMRLVERIAFVTMLILIALLAISYRPDAEASTNPCQRRTLTASQAIDCLWPVRSRALAHHVAECESTASAPERIAKPRHLGRWASDYATHTHWGILQLGPAERKRYGKYEIGSPARVQVASALALFRARRWRPWDSSRARCWGRYA